MSYIKADNPQEQKHFDYLEGLRQSGATNMFGAAAFLRRAFPKDFKKQQGFLDDECGAVLTKWIRLHDDPARVLRDKESA